MKTLTSDCIAVTQASHIRTLLTFFALMMLSFTYSIAQTTITSTGTGGPWNVGSTWVGGVVPSQGSNNNVVIAAGATVTVPASASCVNLTVNGNLTMSGTSINLSIGNPGSNTGSLTLGSGSNLFIGATNTLEFKATQTGPGITNNGGTIASTGTNGADGGTILINTNSGGGFFVGGTSGTTVNNFTFLQNATFNISGPSLLVNGTFTIPNNNWGWAGGSKSPIYGPASTLYVNRGNQGYAQGIEWSANTGTIGVTPGYPNNVVLVNMGSSSGGTGGTGWVPTGAIGLNGTLQVGDGTTNGRISLENVTSFNCGGILVENNSLMVGPPTAAPFTNRGNFTLQGATTGVFQSMGATINFAGSGTIGAPQTISTTGTSVTFTNMTVSNGTYVQLQDPVNITSTLTLTSGYVGTTTTNILTVNNTATTAVVGGSATAYVNGPLAWSVPATTTGNYVFPIGDRNNGGAYLPLTLSPNTTSGATVTATAFNQNSGGTPGASVTALSTTEYWSVSTSSPFTSGPLVSVTRPTAVAPNNALAVSGTSNGVYNAIGGTPGGNTISGGGIGTASPRYIVMVQAPLSVVKLSGKNAACTGSVGSLIVGGSGGTAPYTYSVDGGAFQASGTFDPLSPGDHSVTVRDATTATATVILKVLGSVVINGNNQNVDICIGESTMLTATNLQNTTPTFDWSLNSSGTPIVHSGATYTVSPVTPTTYYVKSKLYVDNLLTNGSFESGNTGFTSSYSNYTGAQYGTTPGNNGYYSISNAGTNQCQWFSTNGTANGPSLAPQNGGVYFIGDGAIASSMVWSQTITGLTIDTVYKFQYYYAAGDPDAIRAQLRTTVTGGTIATVLPTTSIDITTTNATGWLQATYTITATATSMTITLTNRTASGGTNGNDFFLDNMELLSPCTVTSAINVTVNCSLPATLLNFNAVKQGSGALLTWATTMEAATSHFILEKSTDGISFSPIGTIPAAGNSSVLLNYSYSDPFISSGITYYRLVQYDLDGTAYYSEIKAVAKESQTSIQVLPNPNDGRFVLLIENAEGLSTQATVLNSLGQIVYEGAEEISSQRQMDISALASGIYYLQLRTPEGTTVNKIVKE